jgi:hypothetical protein
VQTQLAKFVWIALVLLAPGIASAFISWVGGGWVGANAAHSNSYISAERVDEIEKLEAFALLTEEGYFSDSDTSSCFNPLDQFPFECHAHAVDNTLSSGCEYCAEGTVKAWTQIELVLDESWGPSCDTAN